MYPNARSELVVVAPGDAGVHALGHFGFFKEAHHETLWRPALDWILHAAVDPEPPIRG
jgi:predicted alpha/beta hydrolase